MQGKVDGAGPVYLLQGHRAGGAPRGAVPLGEVRRRDRREAVQVRRRRLSGRAPGSWRRRTSLGSALTEVARELGLSFESAAAAPSVASHPSPIPRIAVWHLWSDTEATGWLRLALDQEKIPYALHPGRGDSRGQVEGQVRRHPVSATTTTTGSSRCWATTPEWGPMPYTKTAEFPSHGVPDSSDDTTGGIGWGGMANLQEYLNAGGLMITLGNGSALPLEGGLVRGVQHAQRRRLHPRRRAEGQVRASRAPAGLRLPRSDLRLPHGPVDLLGPPRRPPIHRPAVGPAAHEGRPRFRGDGAQNREDRGEDRQGQRKEKESSAMRRLGRRQESRQARGISRDPGRSLGKGPRAGVQLQPDAPRPQPLRLSIPLERHPELERAAA